MFVKTHVGPTYSISTLYTNAYENHLNIVSKTSIVFIKIGPTPTTLWHTATIMQMQVALETINTNSTETKRCSQGLSWIAFNAMVNTLALRKPNESHHKSRWINAAPKTKTKCKTFILNTAPTHEEKHMRKHVCACAKAWSTR